MRVKKVLLVSVPSVTRPEGKKFVLRAYEGQPLWMVYLADALLRAGFEVDTFSADLHKTEEILDYICASDADLVGITAFTETYPNVLEAMKVAKEASKDVVIGGPHPRSYAPQVIQRGATAVVIGDGEEAIVALAKGEIPLSSRVKLRDLPIPKLGRAAVRMEEYFQAHQRCHPESLHRFPASIHTQRGCLWRMRHGGCKFCTIGPARWMGRRAEQVWEEVGWLVETYGIDFLWDPADSFTCNRSWLRSLAKAKPKISVSPPWSIYARADEINPESITFLQALPVERAYLGIESGTQEVLDAINKGTTLEQNRQAVQLLTQAKIVPHLSLIVGLPGENEKTLEATYRHTAELAALGPCIVTVHTFAPWPGTIYFQQLSEVCPQFAETDLLDSKAMRIEWIGRFCSVSPGILSKAATKIMSLGTMADDATTDLD